MRSKSDKKSANAFVNGGGGHCGGSSKATNKQKNQSQKNERSSRRRRGKERLSQRRVRRKDQQPSRHLEGERRSRRGVSENRTRDSKRVIDVIDDYDDPADAPAPVASSGRAEEERKANDVPSKSTPMRQDGLVSLQGDSNVTNSERLPYEAASSQIYPKEDVEVLDVPGDKIRTNSEDLKVSSIAASQYYPTDAVEVGKELNVSPTDAHGSSQLYPMDAVVVGRATNEPTMSAQASASTFPRKLTPGYPPQNMSATASPKLGKEDFVTTWNFFVNGCVGTTNQECEHCKKPFSFFEHKVKDHTYRSPCKVKSDFHQHCRDERVEAKKRKELVHAQVLQVRALLDYRPKDTGSHAQGAQVHHTQRKPRIPQKHVPIAARHSSTSHNENRDNNFWRGERRSSSESQRRSQKTKVMQSDHDRRSPTSLILEERDLECLPNGRVTNVDNRQHPDSTTNICKETNNEMITPNNTLRLQSLMEPEAEPPSIDADRMEPIEQRKLRHLRIISAVENDAENVSTMTGKEKSKKTKKSSIVARLFGEQDSGQFITTSKYKEYSRNGTGSRVVPPSRDLKCHTTTWGTTNCKE